MFVWDILLLYVYKIRFVSIIRNLLFSDINPLSIDSFNNQASTVQAIFGISQIHTTFNDVQVQVKTNKYYSVQRDRIEYCQR